MIALRPLSSVSTWDLYGNMPPAFAACAMPPQSSRPRTRRERIAFKLGSPHCEMGCRTPPGADRILTERLGGGAGCAGWAEVGSGALDRTVPGPTAGSAPG